MANYASIADLIKRYDSRTLGQLVTDDNTEWTEAQLLADSTGVVTAALQDASGEIDAHLRRGGRYTTADLETLTGNSLAYLKRITCKVAFWLLWERRPAWDQDQYEQAKIDSRRALQQLASGEAIFDLVKVVDAGKPSVSAPSRAKIEEQNFPIERFSRFYPERPLPGGK